MHSLWASSMGDMHLCMESIMRRKRIAMGPIEWFLRKLRESRRDTPPQDIPNQDAAQDVAKVIAGATNKYQTEVSAKEQGVKRLSEQELLAIFMEYFAPNVDFYSQPDSPKYQAYFGAVNGATQEMMNQPALFEKATKRKHDELLGMINNKIPGLTNSVICGLIFSVGDYCVIKSNLLCVDFSERVPNCIALFLMLTAQKLPKEQRKQMISAGDGTNTQPLEDAMAALKICDPDWKYSIF